MGLPIETGINEKYVISNERIGINSRITVRRLSDDRTEQLILPQVWLEWLDGVCPTGVIDFNVVEQLCDALFA